MVDAESSQARMVMPRSPFAFMKKVERSKRNDCGKFMVHNYSMIYGPRTTMYIVLILCNYKENEEKE